MTAVISFQISKKLHLKRSKVPQRCLCAIVKKTSLLACLSLFFYLHCGQCQPPKLDLQRQKVPCSYRLRDTWPEYHSDPQVLPPCPWAQPISLAWKGTAASIGNTWAGADREASLPQHPSPARGGFKAPPLGGDSQLCCFHSWGCSTVRLSLILFLFSTQTLFPCLMPLIPKASPLPPATSPSFDFPINPSYKVRKWLDPITLVL